MPITPELRRIYASAPSDQRYLDTLQLHHSAFLTDFFLVNAREGWTFDLGDGTLQPFLPVAFEAVQPTLDGQGQQDLQLAIDNVGRDAMEAIEAAAAFPQEPIAVTVRTYLNVANSVPQITPPLQLTLTEVEVRNAQITGTAGRADTLNRPFPAVVYRIDLFPGLDR